MPVPPHFQFNQGSLQDYLDCPRRFYLRHLRRLAWPGVEAEPVLENERYMQQGARFHTLVQQSLSGVPDEALDRMVQEAGLANWWQDIQTVLSGLKVQGVELFPEVGLRAALGGYVLTARCDLVVCTRDGRLQIYDWKTSQNRTRRERLAARLQTSVYPYLLVRDGAYLNAGRPVQPGQVEMIYWFTRYPGQPERFTYSATQLEADEDRLQGLIAEIASLEEEGFTPSSQSGQSKYCVYRSLCEHGVKAGSLSEREEGEAEPDSLDLDFDFEQVAEVEF